MNRKNLDTLITTLEASLAAHTGLFGLVGFNMGSFVDVHSTGNYDKVDSCGTVGCIAGWCVLLEHGEKVVKDAFDRDADIDDDGNETSRARMSLWRGQEGERKARDWLGLNVDEADRLFMARYVRKSLDDITAEEALTVLKHLRNTGRVNWDIIGQNYLLSDWREAAYNGRTRLGYEDWRKNEEANLEEEAKRESYERDGYKPGDDYDD